MYTHTERDAHMKRSAISGRSCRAVVQAEGSSFLKVYGHMVGLAALGDDLGPCILSQPVNEFEDFPRVSKNVFHDRALYLDE